MNVLVILSAVIALTMYAPLCRDIWKGKVQQNLITFVLWGLLDTIAAVSIIRQGGNFLLPAFYVLGCAAVVIAILKAGGVGWTWVEKLTLVLVLICLIIWKFGGNQMATVASTLAVVTAGIPQLVDAWKKPEKAPIREYIGFTVANFLSAAAGKDWSIAERFYPTACGILTLVFVAFAARRWLRKPQSNPVIL